ncbi:hypothetical protein BO82DRAFT_361708 [Aspergillus uvarum CBS 121591]|uniref:Uncharacterized protein n=1 Tax=Aspergillus uvarum CBS 121591 TaxID=1448315 RepID=A0A319CJ71_9EURO|nr:hypothetical protein BO82DRAFT_361708 [Aspergillus uvarum CBS 121591]PYH85264.1 hypothetical protein BO82DRAFT_361708 [Aspergillus uvarum CBS 121591]
MGVPITPHCVAFMIQDQQIDQAAQVLREAQYPDCKDLDQFAADPGNFQSQIRCHALTGGDPDARYKRPIPAHPYYMVTSDARLYRPSFGGGDGLMLNCLGRQSRKSYPVKMLHPERYVENLVYLMIRDIGYNVHHGWEIEFKCMVSCSQLLSPPDEALATIDVSLGDLQEGPISEWIGLHREWDRNYAAVCVRFAALHRQIKKSGQLGEPLMTPGEAMSVKPEHIENCLKNMEDGLPPFPNRLDMSGWTCQLM